MKNIRKKLKSWSFFLLVHLSAQLLAPSISWAITGGPSQPEVQGFTPADNTNLVDPFTGDFSYNIPLLDVGGYPVNLSYSSGVSMDQEASWVGLGWNLSPGVINRTVRGIPDDFSGEQVHQAVNMKTQRSYGATVSPGVELFGFLNLSAGIGLTYNNYTGYDGSFSFNPSLAFSASSSSSLNVGLGITSSSKSGISLSPEVSFSKKQKDASGRNQNASLGFSFPYNTSTGLQGVSFNASTSTTQQQATAASATKGSTGKVTASGSTGSSISFAKPTYVPKVDFPTYTAGVSVAPKLGGEVFGTYLNVGISGFYNQTGYSVTSKDTRAYGYLYEHNQDFGNSMLDFNRENDGSYSPNRPTLPLAAHTFDIYNVSGQGVAGSFRPFRHDVGVTYDPEQASVGSGEVDVSGIELGLGDLDEAGLNVNLNATYTHSGVWNNSLLDNYKTYQSQGVTSEPAYFAQVGEKGADDLTLYNYTYGNTPVRPEHSTSALSSPQTSDFLRKDNGQVVAVPQQKHVRAKRKPRNLVWQHLPASASDSAFFEKNLSNYPLNTFSIASTNGMLDPGASSKIQRTDVSNGKNGNHMSEISIQSADGSRYVYGLPVYNTSKREITFAVKSTHQASGDRMTYNESLNNADSRDNAKIAGGEDNFYQETRTPSYAYSYLLTSVVSADYVDVTQDGLTPDDLGTWTKFNYTKTSGNYKWRAPYGKRSASYNQGALPYDYNQGIPEKSDDKGSVVYGTKEIYYMHSIETKTHIAKFTIANRNDGWGVQDADGGLDNSGNDNAQYKLTQIDLYTRDDFAKESNPLPIKSVHFVYDYSLCNQVENNQNYNKGSYGMTTGKLTLRQVNFTYQNSLKGQQNSYIFKYDIDAANVFENPSYNTSNNDRWGNFKLSDPNLPNSRFPYCDQTKTTKSDGSVDRVTDKYASAWNLKQIDLPSGGSIQVHYESDDYAFVQNKAAMQMFKVKGCSNDGNGPSSTSLNGNYYLYFDLTDDTDTPAEFANRYLRDLPNNGYLYFRFLVSLKDGFRDFIQGYAHITGGGIKAKGDGTYYGYVILKDVPLSFLQGGGNLNPIQKSGLQSLQVNYPDIAHNYLGGDPDGKGPLDAVKAMAGALLGLLGAPWLAARDINSQLAGQSYANDFVANESFIRLYNPDGAKMGGGTRVKQIVTTDAWDLMTGQPAASYTQQYTYTTTEDLGPEKGRTISSGVAAYEATMGGEENPWKQPIWIEDDRLLAPTLESYIEQPLGEVFFPAPTVGYSKVTVETVVPTTAATHGTGSVVHTFYTAKDFPTIVRYTSPDPQRKSNKSSLANILKFYSYDRMSVTQGFSVELNDMHGKPKSQEIYSENNTLVSSVEYKYKQNDDGSLNHTCNTLSSDGKISQTTLGLEYDVLADFRHSFNSNTSIGVNGNLNGFLILIAPIEVPSLFPKFNYEETEFCSGTVTKVVHHYGILEETIATENSSVISTDNLLYDEATGDVVLTQTSNEYSDPIFHFTYPAHWAYDGMGLSYQNVGATVKSSDGTNYFSEGDEVIDNTGKLFWVEKSGSGLSFVNKKGGLSNPAIPTSCTILRSGRRNMATMSIGAVTSMKNPMIDTDLDGQVDKLAFDKVVNASATEYDQNWKAFCQCGIDPATVTNLNPHILGKKGNWKPVRNFAYLANRTQTHLNDNVNARKDGLLNYFNPFWITPATTGGSWTKTANASTGLATTGSTVEWQSTTEITNYSPFGFELENRDALNRYSAALYGYQNTLPIAVSNNSQYQEAAYDGMEDYETGECADDHFSYRNNSSSVVEAQSHTGRKSIMVPAGGNVSVKKTIVVCPADAK